MVLIILLVAAGEGGVDNCVAVRGRVLITLTVLVAWPQ